jgi:biotin carboxylase
VWYDPALGRVAGLIPARLQRNHDDSRRDSTGVSTEFDLVRLVLEVLVKRLLPLQTRRSKFRGSVAEGRPRIVSNSRQNATQ